MKDVSCCFKENVTSLLRGFVYITSFQTTCRFWCCCQPQHVVILLFSPFWAKYNIKHTTQVKQSSDDAMVLDSCRFLGWRWTQTVQVQIQVQTHQHLNPIRRFGVVVEMETHSTNKDYVRYIHSDPCRFSRWTARFPLLLLFLLFPRKYKNWKERKIDKKNRFLGELN